MSEAAPLAPALPMRARRWRHAAAAVLALLFILIAALWLARKPIAEHFIDDALSARHVPAHYRIERIGWRTQRLSEVRIGDPARPDLIADWVEVDTSPWVSGIVDAVRAGHVQMRARLADGRLSLGAIDRLLPAPSGKPFALPAIDLGVAGASIALATPYGDVSMRVAGSGRLDDGFGGTLIAAAPALRFGTCRTDRMTARLDLRISRMRPAVSGPVSLAEGTCATTRVTQAHADVALGMAQSLDSFAGSARLGIATLTAPGARLKVVSGPLTFTGSGKSVEGTLDLRSGALAAGGVAGSGAAVQGRYRYAGTSAAFTGSARATGLALPASLAARLAAWRTAGNGTPIGPIAARFVTALQAAGRSSDVAADIAVTTQGIGGQLGVSRATLASASGVRATLTSDGAASYRWPGNLARIDSDIRMAGGGLPTLEMRLQQAMAGAPMTGRLVMAPYVAGTASLALQPVDIARAANGAARITTVAALSGPIGSGRIEALRTPLALTWDGGTRLTLNSDCAPLAFDRLRIGTLDVPRSAVTLCPRDGGLLRFEAGAVRGGGALGAVRLGGTLGGSPLALSAGGSEWRLAGRSITVSALNVRLGSADRVTRIDIPRLAGTIAGGAHGTFGGAGGQIGTVPLLLSAADGRWRFAGGTLSLDGALGVADAAKDARFKPLAARTVALSLSNGRIRATGTLVEPSRGVEVADVAITHDLNAGSGRADLTVPGITFGDTFQPDLLTPLTYGLIANVKGSVQGEGHIRWTPQGVDSDGVFRTGGIDLAAAFGPATGIAGEVRFTDLLALETAPGQVATIKTLNPGVPVNDGTIRYQLLPGARIAVEQGRWPFAGGTLTLEPTLLDFGAAQERRMTFTVAGMQAAQFLQQFDFKNLNATGVFDGTLPMVFDASGGRIEDGQLVVREGGGTIAYVGEISQKNVGLWGNFAFQALKSLRYRKLDIVMNGPLAGEMITEVRFAGVGQGVGAKRNFIIDRLQKLPLVFNVRIKAPFRQLIDSAQSFYDPKRLIERNLPALLDEQNKRAAPPVIQPPDSGHVP